jgi:hypothetical protein
VIALGVLAASVGLIRSETAPDLRTLTATGASATTRRTLTAATAAALGLLGAVLGLAFALAASLVWAHASLSALFGDVPLADVLILLAGLPLAAGDRPAADWVRPAGRLRLRSHVADVEAALAAAGLVLLRLARKGEPERRGRQCFKPLRQIIGSVNDTFKGQPDLERHGGHTPPGVLARILRRILALTGAIRHNDHASQPIVRSLIAYDH